MTVYSADGKKLGKIVKQADDTLLVEKGLFFKKDYVVSIDDADQVRDDELWLRVDAAQIEGDRVEPERAAAAAGAVGGAAAEGAEIEEEVQEEEVEAPAYASRAGSAAPAEAMAAGGAEETEEVVVVVEEEEIIMAGAEDVGDAGRAEVGSPPAEAGGAAVEVGQPARPGKDPNTRE